MSAYVRLCIQQLRGTDNALSQSHIWDPTEPIATRPLIFLPSSGVLSYYFHDGNKNVSDLVSLPGVAVHYAYTPFGTPTASAPSENPYNFSAEVYDNTLGLIYYNYRHYHSQDGRWTERDPQEEMERFGAYGFVKNNPTFYIDYLGLADETTHGTRKCRNCDSCDQLLVKTASWVAHYNERYDELMQDNYNFKKNNPRRYNNHIQKLREAEKNTLNCVALFAQKVLDGECSSPIPEIDFTTRPIPSPLPEQKPQLSPSTLAPIGLIPPFLILLNTGGGAGGGYPSPPGFTPPVFVPNFGVGGGGAPLLMPANRPLLWN